MTFYDDEYTEDDLIDDLWDEDEDFFYDEDDDFDDDDYE